MPTPHAVSYRTLVRRPHVLRVFALAMLGRFGYAMLSLAFLFAAADATGSFATAAFAIALFALSGLVMPVQARLLDRYGQRRVLGAVLVPFVIFGVATTVMGSLGVASPAAWLAAAPVMGLSAPSLGPSMRAQWREVTTDGERAAAYSLDAVVEEIVFLGGPLVVGAALTFGPAWPVVGVAVALIAVGVAGLVTSPHRPACGSGTTRESRSVAGPLRRAGFRRLLLVMAASGAVLAMMMTGVAALADAAGTPGAVGVVEAGMGVASVIGGWWWGRGRAGVTRWCWPRQMMVLLAARVPLLVLCALHPRLWWVGVCVAVAGLSVAPGFVVGFTASDEESAPAEHTEASTWVTAAGNVGGSLGTALVGALSSQIDVAFGIAIALTVLAIVAAVRVGQAD